MKIDVEYLEYMWPMRHFLITCGNMQKEANIITVSFCMPVSKEPPLIACAVGNDFYSRKLIDNYNEFIVNVPSENLIKEVYYCGLHSGYDVDKFKETELSPISAKKVKAPVIQECNAHMECVVIDRIETGDKILYIGKVVEAYADNALVEGNKEFKLGFGKFPHKRYTTRF